jgi:hypothetical protein
VLDTSGQDSQEMPYQKPCLTLDQRSKEELGISGDGKPIMMGLDKRMYTIRVGENHMSFGDLI